MIDSIDVIKNKLLLQFDKQVADLRKCLEDDNWINFNSEMEKKKNNLLKLMSDVWEIKTKKQEWNFTISKGA